MFRSRKNITVIVKLYSGLDKEVSLKDYNPYKGLTLQVRERTRLKAILKGLGLKNLSMYAYFINGQRAGLWTRPRENDEISCFRPSAGG